MFTVLSPPALPSQLSKLVISEQEPDATVSLDGAPVSRSPLQAGMTALQRPAVYFLPLAAALLSLHNVRRLLEAVTLHVQRKPEAVHGLTAHLARHASLVLGGIDLLVRDGTQRACIAFG